MRTALIAMAIVGSALTACTPVDHDYHGTVGGSATASVSNPQPGGPTPPPITHVNVAPVTVTGSGESVKTVELESGGYTVAYTASSDFLVVAPVQSSGEDSASIINAGGSGPASGTTTFHSNGRTTFHISNTEGEWSLTFTPL